MIGWTESRDAFVWRTEKFQNYLGCGTNLTQKPVGKNEHKEGTEIRAMYLEENFLVNIIVCRRVKYFGSCENRRRLNSTEADTRH